MKLKVTSKSRAFGPTLVAGLLASLCLSSPVTAKKGGKGGGDGGGGGGGGGETSAPPVLTTPPVNYQPVELTWHEPDHQGVYVNSVNRNGRAVGFVKHPAQAGETAFRSGVINALDASGNPLNTMVDLNDLFSAEVPSGWRIAYARKINDSGQIGCELIPALEPINNDAVEVLLAVADLDADGSPGTLTLVHPGNTTSTQRIIEMNEAGDLLVHHERYSDNRGNQFFDNRLYVRQGDGSYLPTLLPEVNDWTPSFNTALEMASAPHPNRNKLYRFFGSDATLLWEVGRKEDLWVDGMSEDGTVYATKNSDLRPYRVTASGQFPLTDEQASASMAGRTMSRAGGGDEEVLLSIASSGEYQIYQFNLDPGDKGARFSLSDWIAPGSIGWAAISSPIASGDHGYFAYLTNDAVARSFLLAP